MRTAKIMWGLIVLLILGFLTIEASCQEEEPPYIPFAVDEEYLEYLEENQETTLEPDYQASGLTAIVAGYVRCIETGQGIDGALLMSSGVGATRTSRNGEYLMSEIPGSWTIRVTHTNFLSTSGSVRIDAVDDYIRKDFRMHCRDHDSDGICSEWDNCRDTPNGPLLGTCIAGSYTQIGSSCTSQGGCGCDWCDMNQSTYCRDAPWGTACSDCMDWINPAPGALDGCRSENPNCN